MLRAFVAATEIKLEQGWSMSSGTSLVYNVESCTAQDRPTAPNASKALGKACVTVGDWEHPCLQMARHLS